MTDVEAHAVLVTHNCALPSCDREAHEAGGMCDLHRGTHVLHAPSRQDLAEQRAQKVLNGVCKIDGCNHASAGKGGWCTAMCDQHISEEATRRQVKRRANGPKPKPAKTGPVQPAAVAAPAVSGGAQDGASISLVALAQHVEDTRAAFRAAVTALREGVAALEAAA